MERGTRARAALAAKIAAAIAGAAIAASCAGMPAGAGAAAEADAAAVRKTAAALWLTANYAEYAQEHHLSCEAAVVRLALAVMGDTSLTEDAILAGFPVHPEDPELGMVCADIDGPMRNPDGSENWANYGAHPPVVLSVLRSLMAKLGLDADYRAELEVATDAELAALVRDDPAFTGALLWVAADVGGRAPPFNAIGQVFGEHVQFLSPRLGRGGRLAIFDPLPKKPQPILYAKTLNRDLFGNRVIVLRKRGA